jgi:hypothetical protein
MRTGVSPS